jgi:hypothetical protein
VTIVVAVVAILAMGAGAALAFWGSTDSSNPARAAADALRAGSAPTGSATNRNVTVTWTAGSTVGGHAATGYSVHRYASPSGGTAVPATGGCGGTITVLTCTEAGVPPGLWYYTITPSLSLWVGAESARTAVSVNQAPTITTGAGVTFTVGAGASFTVSTTGFPAATISETGTLPSGVTLTNNGNGTATLGGTAGPNTGGTYPLTITAANGTLPNATQSFTLTVGINHLLLGAATTNPVAGTPDNLTITALDGANNVVTTYAGSRNLVFAGATPTGTFSPSVVNSAGVTTTFGATTAITFANGVATVSSGRNGLMTLYKAETATITVSDGTINNGTGLPVTVNSAAPAGLALTNPNPAVSCGSVSGNYSCTASGLAKDGSLTANVSFVDSFGNLAVQSATNDATISLSTPTKGGVSPSSLTILKGTTTSTGTFALTKASNSTATTAITFSTFTLTVSAS